TLVFIENVTGSSHDDILGGDQGDNDLNGAGGTDTVTYASSSGAVDADLGAGNATGDGSDTLENDENLIGSDHNDELFGDAGANTIAGGLGSDDMFGGGSSDTVSFAGSATAVSVDLGAGTATGQGADSVTNIENVVGSSLGDTIVGDGGDNVLD